MDAIRQYIFSVTAAAVICAVLTHISSAAGKRSELVKLLCGLFLTFTVLRPVANIQLEKYADFPFGIGLDAQAAISTGEEYARESMASVIKQETEAYILDKASSLGAEIEVDVVLDENLIPKEVYVKGFVSPYVKGKLQKILSEDISIAKEYQIWIQ